MSGVYFCFGAVQCDSKIDRGGLGSVQAPNHSMSHQVYVWHICYLDESNRFVSLPG